MSAFIIGMFAGGICVAIIMSACVAAGREEECRRCLERPTYSGPKPPKKE